MALATRIHTPWGSPGDLAPPILQWGANWLSVFFIPGTLLFSVVLASAWWPSFSSSPSPCHHGKSSTPSSHSPCHRGGSSFSFSSAGIVRATAGSLHWPPVLGGSASTAIPPSVTHEVQDVSSLAATPFTNVRVLPLTVSSRPSLLGSSRDALGGGASPHPAPGGSCSTVSTAPAPYAAAVPVPAPLPAPVDPIPLPVDRFTLPAIKSGRDCFQTWDLILIWLRSPGFSTGRADSALITDTTNSLASQY